MALNNHPALYTGGAERFNSRPHVQLYAQLAARKQAREEAFDEYIRSLNKNVNTAGLRTVDRPTFDKQYSDWQNFVMTNRDAIRGRKGGADIMAQQKYQTLLNTIAESKAAEEAKKPYVEILLDPNKRDRIDEEAAMNDFAAHDLPIYDDKGERNMQRKMLSPNSFGFNPKYYTPEQWMKYDEAESKSIPKDKINTSLKPHPQDRYYMIESTSSGYSPEKLQALGEYNRNRFAEDRELAYSFKKSHPFDKWIKDNGKEYDSLNQAYKSVYGNDANIMDEDDLFVATRIQKALQPTVSEKTVDNWGARDAQNFEQQKTLQRMRNANARDLLQLRHSLSSGAEEDLWIDEYVDKTISEATQKGINRNFFIGEEKITEKQLDNDIELKKAMAVNGVSPDYITVTKDGKLRPVFFKSDVKAPNGGYKFDAIQSVPVSKDAVKLSLGKRSAGVKQTNMEMNNKPKTATKKETTTIKASSSKPKKVIQNGVEYTLNEKTGEYE
jgi:hypothetical protein